MPDSITRLNKRYYYVLGILLLVLLWQLLSEQYPQVLLPSPCETWQGFAIIWTSGALADNLQISFQRQIIGMSLGLAIGLTTGMLAGWFTRLELLMQPLVSLLLAIPPIILAVMAMVWFGMGTPMTIFLVALLVFPVMHTNTVEGFKSIDPSIIQMSKVYRLPLPLAIIRIYIPGMLHSLIAGFSMGAASSIRLTVMAELLGAREGMGQQIAISRSYLETEQLFAWVLVLLVILASLEFVLIRPLQRWSTRGLSDAGS